MFYSLPWGILCVTVLPNERRKKKEACSNRTPDCWVILRGGKFDFDVNKLQEDPLLSVFMKCSQKWMKIENCSIMQILIKLHDCNAPKKHAANGNGTSGFQICSKKRCSHWLFSFRTWHYTSINRNVSMFLYWECLRNSFSAHGLQGVIQLAAWTRSRLQLPLIYYPRPLLAAHWVLYTQ